MEVAVLLPLRWQSFPKILVNLADSSLSWTSFRPGLPPLWHRTSLDQTQSSMDQRPGGAHEPNHQGSHRAALPLRLPQSATNPSRRLRQEAQDPRGLTATSSSVNAGKMSRTDLLWIQPSKCRDYTTSLTCLYRVNLSIAIA
jgi:hypothetical protein